MSISYFTEKSITPDEYMLTEALGDMKKLWDEVRQYVSGHYPPVTEEWFYSGAKWGWGFRLKRKKRVILYFTPQDGWFYNGFVLGDRALGFAREKGLSPEVMEVIANALKYGEGTGFRLEVKSPAIIPDIKKLIDVKMK